MEAGRTGSPTIWRRRGSGPATTSGSTPTTRSSGSRPPGRSSSCGRSGSTSTIATSKDELRYLLTNADLKALVHQREFSPLVTALLPELPELRHVIVIEDGSDVEPDARARSSTRRRWRATRRSATSGRDPGRPLHPLHRRHHRHAQGCGLAPRGRLLRPRRRHRPRHERSGSPIPPSWSPRAPAEG